MTPTFHALWMLCGLGAAVFAAAAPGPAKAGHYVRLVAWLAMIAGFGLTAFWLRQGHSIDASWVGGLAASVAAWQLVRPGREWLPGLSAGALAAVWASLLHVQGLPEGLALAAAASVPLLSAMLAARRPAFAPPLLREEGLVAILALGIVTGVAPAVAQGWQSALALNLADKGGSMPIVPAWMVSFVGVSMIFGGLWSLWRRG